MKIMDGYIEEVDKLGRVSVSPIGQRGQTAQWYRHVRMLHPQGEGMSPNIGRRCVLGEISGELYVLGTYTDSEDEGNPDVLFDNERMLWAGEYRAVCIMPSGDVSLSSIIKNSNNEYERRHIISYNKSSETYEVSTSNLIFKMLGASTRGNLVMEQDKNGNMVYVFEGKTQINDLGARFRVVIGNPSGVHEMRNYQGNIDATIRMEVDTSISPLGAGDITDNPLEINMGYSKAKSFRGLEIDYGVLNYMMIGQGALPGSDNIIKLGNAAGAEIFIEGNGNISIKTPTNASLNIGASGDISLASPQGVAINISADGQINMTSALEINVQAREISLKGKVNINTAQGAPGFCLIPTCPFTGAPHTVKEVVGV
jgi:hypothetical protein